LHQQAKFPEGLVGVVNEDVHLGHRLWAINYVGLDCGNREINGVTLGDAFAKQGATVHSRASLRAQGTKHDEMQRAVANILGAPLPYTYCTITPACTG
jgi:hypothetical protein